MTIGNNVYVQFSGAMFDGAVSAGSQNLGLTILCGCSGTGTFPVMVNELGQIITLSGT